MRYLICYFDGNRKPQNEIINDIHPLDWLIQKNKGEIKKRNWSSYVLINWIELKDELLEEPKRKARKKE